MHLPTILRPAVIALGCIALAVVPACSSGSGDKSATSGTAGSQKEYCAAIQTMFDISQPFIGSTVPTEQQGPLVEQAVKAASVAPVEVRADFLKALYGDTYARDDVDQYNKSKCGIDTTPLRPPSP